MNLLECFQWNDNEYDLETVKEELMHLKSNQLVDIFNNVIKN